MSQPTSDIFTPDYKSSPYWYEVDNADPGTRNEVPALWLADQPKADALPSSADVVVVGAGYTGLHAAIPLVRAGRHVVVLEAGVLGHGCSTRNGGQVSTSIKPSFATLARKHGQDAAQALIQEGYDSVDWLDAFIEREGVQCRFTRCGSFHGAHSPGQFQLMQDNLRGEIGLASSGVRLIEPQHLATEIGTSRYYGGAVYPQEGSLQPAHYHQELARLALAAGAEIHAHTPALEMEEDRQSVKVRTARGDIRANEVIVATNGYTGTATPALRKRVIPVGSYMIATEPLSEALINSVLPTNRIICDTRKVIYYYRPSPDRSRVIFGGRVSAGEVPAEVSAPRLRGAMIELFPQLQDVRISHSWLGFVAFTFDNLAHVGRSGRIHHALGYCGSGIAMSSYYGARLGHTLAGTSHTAAYLDRAVAQRPELPFRSRPFYSGQPWFLSTAIRYYRWRDRIAR